MADARRQRRLKGDLRVSRVAEAAEGLGMPGGEVVDPITRQPIPGNTKLSSLREAYGAADINGAPRHRIIREDASVAAGERAVESALGLPPHSFRVRNPDGADTRGDKLVGKHRAAHGW